MKITKLHFILFLLSIHFSLFAQTVHTVVDTAYTDASAEYKMTLTVVSEEGKSTVSLDIDPLAGDLEQIYDVSISRDTDARLSGRGWFMSSVNPDAEGKIVVVDDHATWEKGNIGSGEYPTGTPLFYSVNINRTPENGGTARGKRSVPAIYLPEAAPDFVTNEVLDGGNLTLNKAAWVNQETKQVLLRFGFAGVNDYAYYQTLLLNKVSPLYPAGDAPVFIKYTYFSNSNDINTRTDISYGNIFWGYEGFTYALIDVADEWINTDGNTYLWFTFGYPSIATTTSFEINMGTTTSIKDVATLDCKIYPTITNGDINVISSSKISSITVFNLMGNTVYKNINNEDTEQKINLATLSEGVYIVLVESDSKKYLEKIIIK